MKKKVFLFSCAMAALAVSALSVKMLTAVSDLPVPDGDTGLTERDARADVYMAEVAQAAAASVQPGLTQAGSNTINLLTEKPLTEAKFITPELAGLLNAPTAPRTVSASDIPANGYVWSASSLITEAYGGYDTGGGMSITSFDSATGAVTIAGFPQSGLSINATIDLTTGAITIPYQVVGTNSSYGNVAFGDVSTTKPDRTKDVTGQVNADGSISINTWWGLFVDTQGSNYDQLFGAWYQTKATPANSVMEATRYSAAGLSMGKTTFPTVVKQTGANVVTVTNYLGGGKTIEFILNENKTATMYQQVGMSSSAGTWMTIGDMTFEDGTFKTYKAINITTEASDLTKLELKSTGLLTTGYYDGPYDVVINSPEPIAYPVNDVTELQGDGSENNPYKISSLNDLVFLSNKVNSTTEMNAANNYGVEYARVFLGKYFEMTADIDMTGYRFDAIGNDWTHHFAGTFDGKGHTITGLQSEAYSGQVAGLFGRTDTLSVIKNINFVDVKVVNNGTYPAAPIAWPLGSVENVTAKNVIASAASQGAGGIAGLAQTIKNCSVENVSLYAGMGFVGGIAGEVDNLIEDCHAIDVNIITGTTAGYPYGGLVGSLSQGDARRCYTTVTIDGNSNRIASVIGGLFGYVSLGEVDQCFTVANLLGYNNESVNGGIVGRTYGAKLSNCYSIGRVNGYSSRMTGGIAGWTYDYYGNTLSPIIHTEIKNCYTAAVMQAETYQYSPDTEYRETLGYVGPSSGNLSAGYAPSEPVIENIYFDNQMTNYGSTHYGVPTATLTAASGVNGFDPAVWTFTEGQYPRLKIFADEEASLFAASSLQLASDNNIDKVTKDVDLKPLGNTIFGFYQGGKLYSQGHYAKIANNRIVLNDKNEFGTDTLFVVNGKTNYWMTLKVAPIPFEGEGSEESPYLIKTKEDLILLSKFTTVSQQLFPGTYFLMTNDIDLELSDEYLGICTNAEVAANKFMGTFDGGGHTIHRMKMGTVTVPADGSKPSGTGISGFIGRLSEEGVLRNINFAADCRIYGWAQIGSAVGYLYGTVENVRNYADVTGISCWVGGIVGQSTGKVGVIRNCYNAGNVTSGYNNAGGIIGAAYCLIENCMNTGDVSVKSISSFVGHGTGKLNNAGGITGANYGMIARNCLNTGTVYAEDTKAGGLFAGLANSSSGPGNNDVYQSINYGMVYTPDPAAIGAIASTGGTQGQVQGVYFDSKILPIGALGISDALNCKGLTTAELTSGNPLEGYDPEIWDFAAGKYPVLKQFANEEKAIQARQMIVNFGDDSNAQDVTHDATLAVVDGLSWTLAKGEKFKIASNALVPEYPFSDTAVDTLYARFGQVLKPIAIKGVPPIPVAGSGTQEDPYQLSSATDWNNIAAYMTTNASDFEGCYFKVMNDFAFGGDEPAFKPLAADGANYLQFDLDGNSKTISGITMTTTGTFQAAIGVIGTHGRVHDLTLNGKITSAQASTGGFSGKNYGVIENCVNEVAVQSTKGTAAGFAVQTYGNAKYINCVNKATIQAIGTAAGFTATMTNDGGRVTFDHCTNEGVIKGSSTNPTNLAGFVITAYPSDWTECVNNGKFEGPAAGSQYVAGLIANAKGYKEAQPYNFINCGNECDIIGKAYIAGLLGCVDKTAGYVILNMTGCWNKGNVYNASTSTVGSSSGGLTAGLSGYLTPGSAITDCWNEGEIRSDKVVYCGGLFAYYSAAPTATLPAAITGCHNSGKIIANGNQGGGIIAYIPAYTTVSKCWNDGEITGTWGIGGIAGGFGGANSKIVDCYNLASVTASQNRAGGIYGYGTPTTSSCTRCWNIGDVTTTLEPLPTHTATNGAYGIGGIAGQTQIPISDCYNTGTISGQISVGGIIGRTVKGTQNANTGVVNPQTTVRNCYNIGKVIAPADSCGAIVGANTDGTGTYWTEFNVMENCLYASDVLSADAANLNTLAKGVTIAELTKTEISEAFATPADYCLPIVTGNEDNTAALANSAAPVTGTGQNLNKVTSAVVLGQPAGAIWTVKEGSMSISDNEAEYTGTGAATVVLTVTDGEYSHDWTLQVTDDYTTGIDNIGADGKEIESETFYNAAGMTVARPAAGDGQLYLVKVRYTDGTSEIVKLVNK